MKVTVITLADNAFDTPHINVVRGQISEEDRKALAADFSAVYLKAGEERCEKCRYMFFAEVDIQYDVNNIVAFNVSIYGDNPPA